NQRLNHPQRQLKADRNKAVAALRRRMRGLVHELDELLPEDSRLSHKFGLNAPADPETPEAPRELVLTAGAAGHVIALWPRALRADRYEVFRKVLGRDQDFVPVATVKDCAANFNTMRSGDIVLVEVRGVNRAGESRFTAPCQIVLP